MQKICQGISSNFDNFSNFFSLGDTIRIFRRSRSGRPTSAQSTGAGSAECGQDDNLLLRTEDLPAPDTVAGVREANAK